MALFLVSGQAAEAQIASETKLLPGFNMDRDIYELRHTVMPGFHYIYDDITQYAPAAVLLGMKACGYESRTKWTGMLVSDALSMGIMVVTVRGVKYIAGRERLPILCGGTGLYLDSLLQGDGLSAAGADEAIRQKYSDMLKAFYHRAGVRYICIRSEDYASRLAQAKKIVSDKCGV